MWRSPQHHHRSGRASDELDNFDNAIVGSGTISNIRRSSNEAGGIIHVTGGHAGPRYHRDDHYQRRLPRSLPASGELDVQDTRSTTLATAALGIAIDATSELLVDVAFAHARWRRPGFAHGGTITGQAANAGNELENFDNAIVGTGTISNVDLDNDAAGTIDATGDTLTLDTGTTIDNAGLLEATAGGTLDVKDGEINNSGTGGRASSSVPPPSC